LILLAFSWVAFFFSHPVLYFGTVKFDRPLTFTELQQHIGENLSTVLEVILPLSLNRENITKEI